jgi:hypothetical protein
MKTLLIMYAGSEPKLVERLLDAQGAGGWTELTHAHGAGATGRHEESRAWPGNTTVFLSIVPGERVATLTAAIVAARGTLPAGDRLHAAVLPTDTFI